MIGSEVNNEQESKWKLKEQKKRKMTGSVRNRGRMSRSEMICCSAMSGVSVLRILWFR